MSQMAEDSELKCKAGRRPHNRNMQLWLQVCCEEGRRQVLSVVEDLSDNQKSMGSKVRTDRAGLAEFSMSQRKGGGRNWQKDDENKRKQTNKTNPKLLCFGSAVIPAPSSSALVPSLCKQGKQHTQGKASTKNKGHFTLEGQAILGPHVWFVGVN